MKRIYLSLILIMACVAVSAQKVSESKALQKAQQFMKDKQFTIVNQARNRSQALDESPGYYVFNAEKGGFVIVAGDERMPEILGYSERGKIDKETVPCGLKWLLGCYEQMAKNVESSTMNRSKNRTKSDKAPIAPFVSTTWGQSTPFNAMCPKINGVKSLTGCVATAMAQIMNYFCWPNEVTEPIPAYTTSTSEVSMPQLEPTTFTWGYLNKSNISKLMLYCGQAVEMDYGTELSGSYPVVAAEAMKRLFGYDETTNYIEHENYSDEEWNNLLYEELSAKKPILYGGDDGKEGHAFVVCGYSDNLYYINWGWNGLADGYYVLDGISQTLGGYNYNQRAIVGIKPKGTPESVTYYPRRVVMENRAWSYDGWYITGLETISRLSKEYPDNFIGINIHVSDPMMKADNYEAVLEKMPCDPHCLINRSTNNELSPNYPDIKPLVEAKKNDAVANIEVSAVYNKPDKSAIKVTSDCIFGFNSSNEDFRIAFVLLEDNVGPYKLWNDNYSNPDAPDDSSNWLNEWIHKDAHLITTFDAVARGIYGDARGIEGSIPSSIEKNKSYHYEYSFNVPSPIEQFNDEEIQPYNNDNFRIVALVLDKSTGEILNASQTKITYDASIESQTFEFRNKDKRLVADEVVSWKSKGVNEDNLVLGTNLKPKGLTLSNFNGKQASGTATLEILSNTLGSSIITWGMSGEDVTVTGNSKTVSFKTNSKGEAAINLKASNISQFGTLDAKLTATINGFSQSVNIRFIHQQTEVQVGDDIELEEGQGWWFNGRVESRSDNADGLMFGSGKQERYYLATYIPADLFGEKVPTIDGIGFYGSTVGMGNITVWISTHLPAKGEEPDIASFSFPNDDPVVNQFNDIVFNQHYQIPENGVYVGYSFDIVDMNAHRSGSPIIYSEKTRENALWFMTESEPEWKGGVGYVEGNLAIKILFGGNVIKKNAASIKTVYPVFSTINNDTDFIFEINNDGSEPISSFEYEIDGIPNFMEIYGWTMNPYSSQSFGAMVSVGSKANYTEKTMTITKVNGMPNESIEKSMKIPYYISRKKSPTVAVMEEFTGTWCGWSLAANLALDYYQKKFGDKLITICVHGSSTTVKDPMEIPEYSEIRKLNWGMYPSCLINRTRGDKYRYSFDDPMAPFQDGYGEGTFNLDVNIENVLNRIMPGSIEMGATWNNAAQDAINIQTRTTFELNAAELPFEIGYVLLEDGMSGEGIEWALLNDFANMETVRWYEFEELTKLPALVYDQKYDNVPVDAWDAYKGVPGSLVGPFTAGVPVEGSFLADIKGNTLIQNKENLSVVALIVNKETGKIINAAKCKIGDSLSPSGINSIMKMRATFDIYNLQGRKVRTSATSLNGLPKGVYIIDGRKVIK